jgi:uncharacterized membrane protein (DUF373 family)
MLAMVRKFIILGIGATGDTELFALSAAILSLGVVHWLVRDQDERARYCRRSDSCSDPVE